MILLLFLTTIKAKFTPTATTTILTTTLIRTAMNKQGKILIILFIINFLLLYHYSWTQSEREHDIMRASEMNPCQKEKNTTFSTAETKLIKTNTPQEAIMQH